MPPAGSSCLQTGSTPIITGNDIPDDVWRIIAGILSDSGYHAVRYMGVNRTFYDLALDQLYSKETNTVLKDAILSVASKLGINTSLKTNRGYDPQWVLQHRHERSKDGALSFESTINPMVNAVAGMSNVMEFNFEWRDLPMNKNTLIFLTSARTSFDNSLRKLVLRAPISKFKDLLANTNFNNIEELDFHFDYRPGGTVSETPDPYVKILLETVVPFIAKRRDRLQSLRVSSSSATNLSEFFHALPSYFPSLRGFGVNISFHKDFLSDASGLCQILESCAVSLRQVILSANWEHNHLDPVKSQSVQSVDRYARTDTNNINPQSDNKPWVRMNNLLLAHPRCLSSLRSLEIPFISLSNTLPIIQRSCDTLIRLCLKGRYLTTNEIAQVIALFSHRSLEIQYLEIAVTMLDIALLVVLAKGLPDLRSLVLIYEKRHDDVSLYPLKSEKPNPTLWKS
ncbi:hypothetical protein JR316_0012362 [Psilocybe cubensis]|uniref:Uncharacterized protein n=1 Tax=Psilocybe cubensis TaxID=181762 RepID=A0ACB8GHW8_PSICU|nr:hypothetical protein JR316_0012362 [Psilocybe cubensis]KAH9475251.1 hypothetical protein JR316_0012362 [Psilocybe cubensis]